MAMKPILFSTPMVRALLAGTKTQTRRIVKPQPKHRLVDGLAHVTIGMNPADDGAVWYDADGIHPGREVRSPYRVGDVLWVREAHSIFDLRPENLDHPSAKPPTTEWPASVQYRADVEEAERLGIPIPSETRFSVPASEWRASFDTDHLVWRPSIHMPRWACRLFLRVTDVRAQRVQEISEADAVAEGMKPRPVEPYDCFDDPREQFAFAWDSLHGPGAWARNDWVWAYTFERAAKEA